MSERNPICPERGIPQSECPWYCLHERPHLLMDNGEDALKTCTGCDWASWDTAPTFAEHLTTPPAQPDGEASA